MCTNNRVCTALALGSVNYEVEDEEEPVEVEGLERRQYVPFSPPNVAGPIRKAKQIFVD
jgi:hypothetical protein